MALAVVIFPRVTLSLDDEGVLNLRLNFSDSSRILSLVTDILTVVLLVPAVKVALTAVEL